MERRNRRELAVSKLLTETYRFFRQKVNKGEHYLYN